MAASANSSIRVRLFFDYPPPAAGACRMCWLLVDRSRCRVVADLESVIRERFEFSRTSVLNLFIDDCYLPHTESVLLVRDEDSIRVKVDSLVQLNGHSSCPDAAGDKSRKRLRRDEDDKPAENGVGGVEGKKKKRKKKSDGSVEKMSEQTLDDKQEKKAQKKHKKKKKKGKVAEENGPTAPPKPTAPNKPTVPTKNHPSDVDQAGKSTKQHPVHVHVQEAPKKTATAKPVSKLPSSTPAPSKLPSSTLAPSKLLSSSPAPSKLPATKPRSRPSSSSSEIDSSSDEGTSGSLLKKKPTTPAASGPQPSPSAPQPANCAQNLFLGGASLPIENVTERPECQDSDVEEEVKLVIRRQVQQAARSPPPWLARGRSMWCGGRGERGRGHGRGGGRGESGDFQFNYNVGQQMEQISDQHDSLTNNSVVLQNGVETALVRDYSSMPLLAAPPQVGQKIVFKLLELTENYTPEVSEYKEGKILSFDPTTKQIELELLGARQAPVEPGKFDLVYQNADGSESVEYAVTRGSWVTERWDSLLEPRLLI